jgi:hypothetical protein
MAEADPNLRLFAAQQALKGLLAKFHVNSTMTEPLRPQHFITRQNGTMVPLVALDELPATVSIRGVPRALSPYDVAGMTALGTVESQHRQYVVDGPRQGFRPGEKVVENGLLDSKYATAAIEYNMESSFGGLGLRSCATSSTAHPPQPKAFGIKEMRSGLPTILQNDSLRSSQPPPLTIEDLTRNPAPGVKEYCSYWLRHGECDYAQQGCLYRHEMPLDPPTLEKLGLRDIPRWYREKHGLGSYLALTAQRAASGSTRPGLMERNWRNQPEDAKPDDPKAPVTPPEPRNGHPSAPTIPNPVGGWNAFAKSHTPACNSNTRGPLSSPPIPSPVNCQTFPPSSSSSSNDNNNENNRSHPSTANGTPRPGTRLVPASTETISARILREANEQLDADDERERAALMKYAPLVPQKSSPAAAAAAADSGTPTPSTIGQDERRLQLAAVSSPDTEAGHPNGALSPPEGTDGVTSPTVPSTNTIRKARNAAAASAPTPVSASAAKKKIGRGPRARRGVDAVDVDREAQRKAVGRAKAQAEDLARAKGVRGMLNA